jgi:hypothetical protein
MQFVLCVDKSGDGLVVTQRAGYVSKVELVMGSEASVVDAMDKFHLFPVMLPNIFEDGSH